MIHFEIEPTAKLLALLDDPNYDLTVSDMPYGTLSLSELPAVGDEIELLSEHSWVVIRRTWIARPDKLPILSLGHGVELRERCCGG
jgi:hypothetical protein